MMTQTTECRVCYGPCDMEIHQATIRIHAWLKERTDYLIMPVQAPQKSTGLGSMGGKPKKRKFGETKQEAEKRIA